MQRCHMEVDFDARLLLATCLGEVGAIAPNRLGETRADFNRAESSGNDSSLWRLKQAPWQSRPVRYELKVVTNHLVVALKAAPSSADQNKIAFAIQQLLELLDEHAKMSSRSDSKFSASIKSSTKSSQTKMSDWLREQLSDAGVIETIEPFWGSQFKEVSARKRIVLFFADRISYSHVLCRLVGSIRNKGTTVFSWRIVILHLVVVLVAMDAQEKPRRRTKPMVLVLLCLPNSCKVQSRHAARRVHSSFTGSG